MRYSRQFSTFLLFVSSTVSSAAVFKTGPLFSATRPECREFAAYSTRAWDAAPDGFIVAKNGEVQFEYYDKAYGPDRPHALWSVSKTFTGALLGIAVRDGKISFDQKLSDFYPREKNDAAYESIRISDLFYSDTGFVWDESSLDLGKNSVLPMLFGDKRGDMAAYVAGLPVIKQGAGYRWQYNTGTPTLAMGVLKKAYGDEYASFPWKKLFNPLGMTSVALERDGSGTFVGAAYAWATPRDLLKLGQLYLQRGRWNGEQILPEEWINRTLTVSPGFQAPGTTREQISKGINLVYGGLMWLNRHGRPELPKPFPKSPDDMFMALGREGQFILVLPSQQMVFVRTGRGPGTIDPRIDGIVTRALACLHDPTTPLADSPPHLEKKSRPSLWTSYKLLRRGMQKKIVQAAVAKWMCSCHFVSRLPSTECLKRSNIPLAGKLTKVRFDRGHVKVKPSLLGIALTSGIGSVTAVYNPLTPSLGCELPLSH